MPPPPLAAVVAPPAPPPLAPCNLRVLWTRRFDVKRFMKAMSGRRHTRAAAIYTCLGSWGRMGIETTYRGIGVPRATRQPHNVAVRVHLFTCIVDVL